MIYMAHFSATKRQDPKSLRMHNGSDNIKPTKMVLVGNKIIFKEGGLLH